MNAASWGHLNVVIYLKDAGSSFHSANIVCVFFALTSVHTYIYISFENWCVPFFLILRVVQDGRTALMMAAQEGHLYVVVYLKEAGADFDLSDIVSALCLHLHAFFKLFYCIPRT